MFFEGKGNNRFHRKNPKQFLRDTKKSRKQECAWGRGQVGAKVEVSRAESKYKGREGEGEVRKAAEKCGNLSVSHLGHVGKSTARLEERSDENITHSGHARYKSFFRGVNLSDRVCVYVGVWMGVCVCLCFVFLAFFIAGSDSREDC